MAAKYERITDDLREQILSLQLPPGTRLRSQTALADEYRVSLPTVREALSVLEQEGLIDSVQGIGTYVREARQRVRRETDRYQWEKNRARLPLEERRQTGAVEHDTGLNYRDLAFHAEYRTVGADEDLAAAFGISVGTKLLHRIYRTRVQAEGTALSLIDSYLVYEVAAANPELLVAEKEPWPGGTMSQLHTIGIEIDRITDEITARPPQGDEAAELGISPGVAVIVLRKTSIATTGDVAEVSDVVMPGDRTQLAYCTQLDRWES